jgi:hypothetical protein
MGLCVFSYITYRSQSISYLSRRRRQQQRQPSVAYRGYIVDCTYTHKLYTLDLTCRAMAAMRDISHMRRGATVNSRYAR